MAFTLFIWIFLNLIYFKIYKGDKGEPGRVTVLGPRGPKGECGLNGIRGDNGFIGLDGSNGSPGDFGLPGFPGNYIYRNMNLIFFESIWLKNSNEGITLFNIVVLINI